MIVSVMFIAIGITSCMKDRSRCSSLKGYIYSTCVDGKTDKYNEFN